VAFGGVGDPGREVDVGSEVVAFAVEHMRVIELLLLPVISCTGGRLVVLDCLHMYHQYMSDTAALSISDARSQLAAIIDRARADHQPVYVARRGRRVAAVIDADDLDRIIELAEDMADIRAAEQARAEMTQTGAAPIPWDEVKADLGLT
jgi:prevent-host-death family protein